MTSTEMSGPLAGLVGSKNRSLRPYSLVTVVAGAYYRRAVLWSNRILPYGSWTSRSDHPAGVVVRWNFFPGRPWPDNACSQPWGLPAHLENRCSAIDDSIRREGTPQEARVNGPKSNDDVSGRTNQESDLPVGIQNSRLRYGFRMRRLGHAQVSPPHASA